MMSLCEMCLKDQQEREPIAKWIYPGKKIMTNIIQC